VTVSSKENGVVDLVILEMSESPVAVALISVPGVIVQRILVPVSNGLVDS
jgi:hypothetical protein